MSNFEEVFKAISHRTRRELLSYLYKRKEAVNSGELKDRFLISWPTLCKHLDKLVEARVVVKQSYGREVYYHLNQRRLVAVVKTWISSFE